MKLSIEKIQTKYWIIPIFLVSLVYILDIRFFTSPPLHSDDWSALIFQYIFEDLKLIDFSDRRPLISFVFSVLSSVFGLQIQYYYLVNFILIFFAGALLYQITVKSFPNYSWLALPVALIFLIYPLDLTKTWLITINSHFVLLIDLLVILLLLLFVESGKFWKLILANLLFLFSLGIYEGGLGIVILAAVVMAIETRKISKTRSYALISVIIIGVIFIVWRLFIQPTILDIQDSYVEQISTSISTIAYRYAIALIYTLYCWIRPLTAFLGQSKFLIMGILGIIFVGILIVTLPKRIRVEKTSSFFPWNERKQILRSLSVCLLIGILFWVAGYFPVISLVGTKLDGNSTRNNLFAIAGISLSLVAGITIIITLITRALSNVKRLASTVTLLFIIIGLVYQIWSQEQRFQSWNVQKQIWNKVFEIIPGLKADSKVGIIISGYAELDQFEILPFTWRWDARTAMRVLYNATDIDAFYFYPERLQNIVNMLPEESNWSQYILIHYDPVNQKVDLLEHPEETLSNNNEMIGYKPKDRIINQSLDSLVYRWLVK